MSLEAAQTKLILLASGAVAASVSATPTAKYGSYLLENGIWLLSYGEWLRVLAAIWVTILIIKDGLYPLFKLVKKALRRK